ncbi:MAG TPA: sensor histidine kinase, partial [Brevundimonas sp.]
RLAALASIQATLARTQSGQADLEDIVRQELVHSVGSDEGIEVEGPTILLKGRTVELIALALHELAANAVKFGALSTGGRLAVTWTHAPTAPGSGQNLILSWKETGVASADPDHAGFGLELIKRGLPYELDADVAVDFTPTGLECTILLPLGRGGA